MVGDLPEAAVSVGGEAVAGTIEETAVEPVEGEQVAGFIFSDAKPTDPAQLALEIRAARDLLRERHPADESVWLKGKAGEVPEMDNLRQVLPYDVSASERNASLK